MKKYRSSSHQYCIVRPTAGYLFSNPKEVRHASLSFFWHSRNTICSLILFFSLLSFFTVRMINRTVAVQSSGFCIFFMKMYLKTRLPKRQTVFCFHTAFILFTHDFFNTKVLRNARKSIPNDTVIKIWEIPENPEIMASAAFVRGTCSTCIIPLITIMPVINGREIL